MTVFEFLVLLLVAAICGGVAQAIVGFNRRGCLVSAGMGFLGALIGTWLARALGLPEIFMINLGGVAFPIVWSIIGAIVLALAVGLLTGRVR